MPWSANMTPVANAVMPRIEPTERSMLRVTTTIVWPTASSATIVTLSRMSRRFCALRKRGSASETPSTRIASTPIRLTSRARTIVSMNERLSSGGAPRRRRSALRSARSRRQPRLDPSPRARPTPRRPRRARARGRSGPRASRARGRPSRAPRAARRRSSAPRGPSPASSDINRCTSAFVPTSMPRVGSSMIRTFGPVASHLPSTTFCWLPPERNPTGSESFWNFSCSLVAQSDASLASEPEPITPSLLRSACRRVRPMLRSIESSITRPCWRRSSGTSPMPAFIAAARRAGLELDAVDGDVAGVGRVDAEDRARDLAAARADEARERDDLAAVDVEGDVDEHALAREPRDLEHLLADLRPRASGTAARARGRPSGARARRCSCPRSCRRA